MIHQTTDSIQLMKKIMHIPFENNTANKKDMKTNVKSFTSYSKVSSKTHRLNDPLQSRGYNGLLHELEITNNQTHHHHNSVSNAMLTSASLSSQPILSSSSPRSLLSPHAMLSSSASLSQAIILPSSPRAILSSSLSHGTMVSSSSPRGISLHIKSNEQQQQHQHHPNKQNSIKGYHDLKKSIDEKLQLISDDYSNNVNNNNDRVLKVIHKSHDNMANISYGNINANNTSNKANHNMDNTNPKNDKAYTKGYYPLKEISSTIQHKAKVHSILTNYSIENIENERPTATFNQMTHRSNSRTRKHHQSNCTIPANTTNPNPTMINTTILPTSTASTSVTNKNTNENSKIALLQADIKPNQSQSRLAQSKQNSIHENEIYTNNAKNKFCQFLTKTDVLNLINAKGISTSNTQSKTRNNSINILSGQSVQSSIISPIQNHTLSKNKPIILGINSMEDHSLLPNNQGLCGIQKNLKNRSISLIDCLQGNQTEYLPKPNTKLGLDINFRSQSLSATSSNGFFQKLSPKHKKIISIIDDTGGIQSMECTNDIFKQPQKTSRQVITNPITPTSTSSKDIDLPPPESSSLDSKPKILADQKSQSMGSNNHNEMELWNRLREKDAEILELKNERLKYEIENQAHLLRIQNLIMENKKLQEVVNNFSNCDQTKGAIEYLKKNKYIFENNFMNRLNYNELPSIQAMKDEKSNEIQDLNNDTASEQKFSIQSERSPHQLEILEWNDVIHEKHEVIQKLELELSQNNLMKKEYLALHKKIYELVEIQNKLIIENRDLAKKVIDEFRMMYGSDHEYKELKSNLDKVAKDLNLIYKKLTELDYFIKKMLNLLHTTMQNDESEKAHYYS